MSARRRDPDDVIFLWAAIGGPSALPDRLQVVICPRCAALVPIRRLDRHEDWHRTSDDSEPQP